MNRSHKRLHLRTFCLLTNALTYKNLHLKFINVNIRPRNVQISIEIKAFEPCLVCLFKLFFFFCTFGAISDCEAILRIMSNASQE